MRALVLSGAGAGIFAHGGALDAIRAKGETFDYVSGASAGAIAAALYAAGREWRLGGLAETVSATDLWGTDGALPIVTRVDRLRTRMSWLDHAGLVRLIERELDDQAVEAIRDSGMKLEIPAYDITRGVPVWWPENLGANALRTAVLASASIPVGLPPITMEDAAGVKRTLVDGGVTENHPIRRAAMLIRQAGGGAIVCVSALQKPREGPLEGVFDLVERLVSAFLQKAFSADLEAAAQLEVPVHLIHLGKLDISLLDFTREQARAAYMQGHLAARSQL